MDEKSFLRGQGYTTIVYPHNRHCVFSVEHGRSAETGAKAIQQAIPEPLRDDVKAVTMDFSEPYAKAVHKELPKARIVADRFHISKLLGEALMLEKQHNEILKDTRMLRLKDQRQLKEDKIVKLNALINKDLKTAEAWHLKEAFKHFLRAQQPLKPRDILMFGSPGYARANYAPCGMSPKPFYATYRNFLTNSLLAI